MELSQSEDHLTTQLTPIYLTLPYLLRIAIGVWSKRVESQRKSPVVSMTNIYIILITWQGHFLFKKIPNRTGGSRMQDCQTNPCTHTMFVGSNTSHTFTLQSASHSPHAHTGYKYSLLLVQCCILSLHTCPSPCLSLAIESEGCGDVLLAISLGNII